MSIAAIPFGEFFKLFSKSSLDCFNFSLDKLELALNKPLKFKLADKLLGMLSIVELSEFKVFNISLSSGFPKSSPPLKLFNPLLHFKCIISS